MSWVALNCPQCSAPLPRIAIWRSVKCPSCGALIVRNESLVYRDSFRKALLRAQQEVAFASADLQIGGERYRLLEVLGHGEISQVHLARRLGVLPYLATIKLSDASSAAAQYAREAQALRALHAIDNGGSSTYFSQHLPEVMAEGVAEGGEHTKRALVLRHPYGFWGSLEALSERYGRGLDPRHGVWIWRRILGILSFVHAVGWVHGDVRPEHALVHPQDHGVRLIGWASAHSGAGAKERAMDLQRSARVVLALLGGARGGGAMPNTVPEGLAQLVTKASEDVDFCHAHGSEGLDNLLRAESRNAFGPPTFVPLML